MRAVLITAIGTYSRLSSDNQAFANLDLQVCEANVCSYAKGCHEIDARITAITCTYSMGRRLAGCSDANSNKIIRISFRFASMRIA